MTLTTFLRALVTIITCVVLLAPMTGTAQAAEGDGVARKSIFVDLGAASPLEIWARVQKICSDHRHPDTDDFIQNVVLVNLIDHSTGALRVAELAAVLPHVPGGYAQPCFDNVFVGPTLLSDVERPWQARPDFPPNLEPWCADNPYCGGILTPSWRWDNLVANRVATDQFLAFISETFPEIRPNLHWYIPYEGYFDWLGDNAYSPQLRTAYEAYLLQSVKDYHDALVTSGEPPAIANRAVLWSPTYASAYNAVTVGELVAIRANLRSMFTNVQQLAAQVGITRGVDWLHMQDRLGQTGCFNTDCYRGVISWYHFLTSVNHDQFSFANLRVNMEQFTPTPTYGDPAELSLRQDFYESNGIPLGAAWELQWWLPPAVVPVIPTVDPLVIIARMPRSVMAPPLMWE